ncbi:MAG: PDZ domain-containing protein [Candidatus Cloacimonetes bacterium]|nr:PDZ domain-containing protein [Candidatus Cloacimonadota bacterium]
MKQNQGYYRHATVYKDQIVFVAEDDLWKVKISGGTATRLTANLGQVSNPFISDNGQLIAFIGSEEGTPEVYVMPVEGGTAKRLTYLNSACRVIGWKDGKILFFSNHGQPFRQNFMIYAISPDGGEPQKLPYGLATSISFGKKGVVLGRKAMDLATWKRYRGGTAGEIWIDTEGKGKFTKLIDLKGNFANPMWLGDRIFFVSDYEGIANIYSVNPSGKDIIKHTKQKDYYVRNATTDGQSIVYHAGADIYCYDIKKDQDRIVKIDYRSPFIQRQRKFVTGFEYLEDCDLNADGSKIALECRGKLFNMGNWEGGVIQCGNSDGVRYRLGRWLNDNKRIITVSDESGEEHLEIYEAESNKLLKTIKIQNPGRFVFLEVSPTKKEDIVVYCNHRNELYWLDLKGNKPVKIDKNEFGSLDDAVWSPDGRWIAYSIDVSKTTRALKLYNLEKKAIHQITKPIMSDSDPYFSSDGKYLYFVSSRIFNPVYDAMHFDLGFPQGSLPYVITLTKDTKDPFEMEPKGFNPTEKDEKKSEKKDKKKEELRVKIDLEGIEDRITPFPLKEANYYGLSVTNNRIFYLVYPVSGVLDNDDWLNQSPKSVLKFYDLEKRKEIVMANNVSGYRLSADGSAIGIFMGKKLRVLSTKSDPESLSKEDGNNRETGWINLNRVRISINPPAEWKQMYAEAWRLQRDYFWVEDMSGIDWKKIYKRYFPLLDRIATRTEFADLVWEMQGELGTSHAYEFGGDYKKRPWYLVGQLGADFQYDPKSDSYIIKHIVEGDVWDKKHSPPLKKPGLNIKVGMLLKAINGTKLSRMITPEQALVNYAGQEVQLLIAENDGKKERQVTVKTLRNDINLRYREWVERNKEYVHQKTKGKVGYIHIPDMMGEGYAEFHRHFLTEYDHDALIVDVRYNGGGHVSQLLLEKLARKRIGYDLTRWYGYDPYPEYSVKGPIVVITNEFAGSDGDIFSHSFKLMKLGKLIGKRTWGGVIGISPRNRLVDGGITTQPEFSFWFKDVGWNVENYGTDPDIEVDITPQDYAKNKDPQMEKALEVIAKEMKQFKYLKPKFDKKPKLTLP